MKRSHFQSILAGEPRTARKECESMKKIEFIFQGEAGGTLAFVVFGRRKNKQFVLVVDAAAKMENAKANNFEFNVCNK